MSTGYAGSNFGIISINNSGSGTLSTSGSATAFSYENVQNMSSGTVFLTVDTPSILTFLVYYSNDSIGSNPIVMTYPAITESQTFTIPIQAAFLKIEFVLNDGTNIGYQIQTIFKNSISAEATDGLLSAGNSIVNGSLDATGLGAIHEGVFENVENYSLICIDAKADSVSEPAAAVIRYKFSTDKQNIEKEVVIPIQNITSKFQPFNPSHTILPIAKYFQVDLENESGQALSNVQFSVLYHKTKSRGISTRINDEITDYRDVQTTKSILFGKTKNTLLPGGHYQNISTLNGNLSTSILSPNTAFGELLNASNYPFVQFDFSAGEPLDSLNVYRNNVANTSYEFKDSKGTVSVNGGGDRIIQLDSNQFTKYKAGQGSDNRFTAVFDPSGFETGFHQYAGVFTPEDSLCFGYFDVSGGEDQFSIRYQSFGQQQISEIKISDVNSPSGTLIYNLQGTTTDGFDVTGLDANAIAQRSAEQIQEKIDAGFYGFSCEYYDVSSALVYDVIATLNGCELNGGNVNISIVEPAPTGVIINSSVLRNSQPPTTEIIPQIMWNIDTCLDMGTLELNYLKNPSGFRLDPTKGNVYKITFQYLGFGSITFSIENTENGLIIPVHQIQYANTSINPTLRDPNLRIGIGVEALSTSSALSSISTSTTSCASFLQGEFRTSPIYRSYGITLVGNKENALNSGTISRSNPAILFGITGTLIYRSENSDGSLNYVMNNNNIFFTSLTLSINADSSSTNTNIILLLIKNPDTLNTNDNGVQTSNGILPVKNQNNSLINTVDGVPLTDTNTGNEIDTGFTVTGGNVILDVVLIQRQSTTINLADYNIVMTPLDSYFICYYGSASGSGNADIEISGSISYNVNM